MADLGQQGQPSKPMKLPSLRQGLSLSFSDYDLDGKPQWVIHDAGRNKFFIIGWTEYEILNRWDLGTPEAIINAVNSETTLDIDMEDLESMMKFLSRHFLFKQSGYQIKHAAEEQEIFKNDNPFHWLINYYLFFRIPLVHPDKFLVRTKAIADFAFSRILGYVMAILGIIALYQVTLRWEDFTHTFSTLISWQGFMLYMLVFVFCKLFHELGHAYMCRSYGIPVPSLGVAFLVFFPVLYTDTTLSWSLNSRQRLRIALAGMWIETYVTIIAALIWANSSNPTLQTICYLVVAVNWVASLLINVSPFMRFDGYYVLADLLKMPNLQPRAFALTRWQMRKILFGWNDPPPEKFSKHLHNLLVVYSVITWVYRFTLYIGIAVLVYHFVIKIVGIILFIIELHYFLLAPFVNEFRTWLALRDKFTLNTNTVITIAIASTIVICFFLPINETVKMPATISYDHRFLIAPEEGIISNEPPTVGDQVKASQPIIVIDSDDIEHDLRSTYLEYTKSINEIRRASVSEKFSHQKNVLLSSISKEQSKYKKLHDTLEKMTLSVPFDGIIIDLAPDLQKGNLVMKNEWLGDVAMPTQVRVEAFAKQSDMNLLKDGLHGYFYPRDISYPRVPVKIEYIEVQNSNELTCNVSQEVRQNKDESFVVETPCYNVSDLGGDVATYSTDEGKYVPIESTYRVLLLPSRPTRINQIQRGTVIVETEPRSYAQRVFYKAKKILIEQSGF